MTEEVQQPEEQESLRDALAAKLEEQMKEEPEEEVVDESDDTEQPDDGEESESEEGGEEDIPEGPGESDEEPEEEVGAVEPPFRWNKEQEEFFESLPDEVKEIAKQYDDMGNKAVNKKLQEISESRKDIELWDTMFSSYDDTFKQANVTRQQYVSGLMQWDRETRQDPITAVKKLMQATGVTAEHLGIVAKSKDSDEDFMDYDEESDRIKQLEAKIAKLGSTPQSNGAGNTLDMERQLLAFQYEEDDKGNLKHPHFKEAMSDMLVTVRS
jgi:hypothetical protein